MEMSNGSQKTAAAPPNGTPGALKRPENSESWMQSLQTGQPWIRMTSTLLMLAVNAISLHVQFQSPIPIKVSNTKFFKLAIK